ncbi:MAG: hypothetical protein COB90_02450 [Hyphomicrobiales bacterium]|nr:MAG: hypothetical protein COB90_02450 [Hyphomicrobiales bacterium]
MQSTEDGSRNHRKHLPLLNVACAYSEFSERLCAFARPLSRRLDSVKPVARQRFWLLMPALPDQDLPVSLPGHPASLDKAEFQVVGQLIVDLES